MDLDKRGVQLPATPFGFWRGFAHGIMGIVAFGAVMDAARGHWSAGDYAIGLVAAYAMLAVPFEGIRYLVRRCCGKR